MDGAVDEFDDDGGGELVGAHACVESVAYGDGGKGADADAAITCDAGRSAFAHQIIVNMWRNKKDDTHLRRPQWMSFAQQLIENI